MAPNAAVWVYSRGSLSNVDSSGHIWKILSGFISKVYNNHSLKVKKSVMKVLHLLCFHSALALVKYIYIQHPLKHAERNKDIKIFWFMSIRQSWILSAARVSSTLMERTGYSINHCFIISMIIMLSISRRRFSHQRFL